jgi:Fe-Mn family superoxide dismutase
VDKRTFLRSLLLGTAGVAAKGLNSPLKAAGVRKKWDGIFRIPELDYSTVSLEPFMNKEVLNRHFSIYSDFTANFNRIVSDNGLRGKTIHEIFEKVSELPESFRFNGGGYFNHKLFWRVITPGKNTAFSAELSFMINRSFDSEALLKTALADAADRVSGSGWAWLVAGQDGSLFVTATSGNDNPLMNTIKEKGFPLLCIDAWDHATAANQYSNTTEYVNAFWNHVNKEVVSKRYVTSGRYFSKK